MNPASRIRLYVILLLYYYFLFKSYAFTSFSPILTRACSMNLRKFFLIRFIFTILLNNFVFLIYFVIDTAKVEPFGKKQAGKGKKTCYITYFLTCINKTGKIEAVLSAPPPHTVTMAMAKWHLPTKKAGNLAIFLPRNALKGTSLNPKDISLALFLRCLL